MPYDYTDAPTSKIEPIPHGTIATLVLHIKAGGVGEDNMLKRSKDGGCEMLECELTITDGSFKGRKFWERWILEGTTDGHSKAAEISRRTLKAILDSALGLKPDDASPEARKARTLSLGQFEGMTFIGRIGVEKGDEKYPDDKNSSQQSSRPTKRNGTPVSSRRRSTAAMPQPRHRPQRRLRRPTLRPPSHGRDGHREEDPHHRRGLPLRARGRLAAGRYRCRHCGCAWGRSDGRPHPTRNANRTPERY
jgi:hypothetical protein